MGLYGGQMKAVIMAGGAGSRLRPLTSNQPKPMVSLANRPLMEHIVRLLKRHGFTDIVVTVQFLASLVRNYFGTGEDLGVSLSYATEESPLGTAGSVKNAEGALDETFLVISGDALTDIDLEKVIAYHQERESLATIVLSHQPNPLEHGIVVTDEEGRIEIPGFEIADRVWVGEGAILDPDARIEGPALIGEHVKVEGGATVREYCVIGSNTAIKSGAFLHRSIVHDNAYVGPGASLRGCV